MSEAAAVSACADAAQAARLAAPQDASGGRAHSTVFCLTRSMAAYCLAAARAAKGRTGTTSVYGDVLPFPLWTCVFDSEEDESPETLMDRASPGNLAARNPPANGPLSGRKRPATSGVAPRDFCIVAVSIRPDRCGFASHGPS